MFRSFFLFGVLGLSIFSGVAQERLSPENIRQIAEYVAFLEAQDQLENTGISAGRDKEKALLGELQKNPDYDYSERELLKLSHYIRSLEKPDDSHGYSGEEFREISDYTRKLEAEKLPLMQASSDISTKEFANKMLASSGELSLTHRDSILLFNDKDVATISRYIKRLEGFKKEEPKPIKVEKEQIEIASVPKVELPEPTEKKPVVPIPVSEPVIKKETIKPTISTSSKNKPTDDVLIHFNSNSDAIGTEAQKDLLEISEKLKADPSLKLEASGHADCYGDAKYNLVLSKRRVKAVTDNLIQLGVSETQISTSFFGETKPLVENKPKKNSSKNRRVLVKIKNN